MLHVWLKSALSSLSYIQIDTHSAHTLYQCKNIFEFRDMFSYPQLHARYALYTFGWPRRLPTRTQTCASVRERQGCTALWAPKKTRGSDHRQRCYRHITLLSLISLRLQNKSSSHWAAGKEDAVQFRKERCLAFPELQQNTLSNVCSAGHAASLYKRVYPSQSAVPQIGQLEAICAE